MNKKIGSLFSTYRLTYIYTTRTNIGKWQGFHCVLLRIKFKKKKMYIYLAMQQSQKSGPPTINEIVTRCVIFCVCISIYLFDYFFKPFSCFIFYQWQQFISLKCDINCSIELWWFYIKLSKKKKKFHSSTKHKWHCLLIKNTWNKI